MAVISIRQYFSSRTGSLICFLAVGLNRIIRYYSSPIGQTQIRLRGILLYIDFLLIFPEHFQIF